jgi:hypothetical protein
MRVRADMVGSASEEEQLGQEEVKRDGLAKRGNGTSLLSSSTLKLARSVFLSLLNSSAALAYRGSAGQARGVPQQLAQVKICERRGLRMGRIGLIG